MNNEIKTPNLMPRTINAIRDLAVQIESNDLEAAQELMYLAHIARPEGPFIKNKLDEYNKKLIALLPAKAKLNKMISASEVVIIPIGFRCTTKATICNSLGISQQQSLPFDSGFFPPSAVASVIKHPIINLSYPDNYLTHSICIKYENYTDHALGLGIKFKKSTYDEINAVVTCRDMKDINSYLDSTYGYYTLDLRHNFVLAHYNWHELADLSLSKGVSNPELNIKNINDTLNRRIKRMFDLCNSAKYIFFVFGEYQQYNYMIIDDCYFDLHDLKDIEVAAKDTFSAQSFVVTSAEIDSADKVLKIINILA